MSIWDEMKSVRGAIDFTFYLSNILDLFGFLSFIILVIALIYFQNKITILENKISTLEAKQEVLIGRVK